MTCRDAVSLLPLFVDGELDSRRMRMVALHSTRCENCERELRRLERLQELVSEVVGAGADEVDASALWSVIQPRLGSVPVPWWQRAWAWWPEGEGRGEWAMRLPAVAVAAILAVFALFVLTRAPQLKSGTESRQVLAAGDNAVSIDSLSTDVDSVAVLNDPETRTMVLWVSDDRLTGGTWP